MRIRILTHIVIYEELTVFREISFRTGISMVTIVLDVDPSVVIFFIFGQRQCNRYHTVIHGYPFTFRHILSVIALFELAAVSYKSVIKVAVVDPYGIDSVDADRCKLCCHSAVFDTFPVKYKLLTSAAVRLRHRTAKSCSYGILTEFRIILYLDRKLIGTCTISIVYAPLYIDYEAFVTVSSVSEFPYVLICVDRGNRIEAVVTLC